MWRRPSVAAETRRTNDMLKGLGGLGDMAGMMKKAQEMQTKMAQTFSPQTLLQ